MQRPGPENAAPTLLRWFEKTLTDTFMKTAEQRREEEEEEEKGRAVGRLQPFFYNSSVSSHISVLISELLLLHVIFMSNRKSQVPKMTDFSLMLICLFTFLILWILYQTLSDLFLYFKG